MTTQSGTLWRTAYEIDFGTLANQNIKTGGNGNKTIDGKVWLWGNDANCASADVVNGTGIVIVANAVNTGYYEGGLNRTAPNLTIPVTTVLPRFDIAFNILRVTTRIVLTNADAVAEGGKLFMEHATVPDSQSVAIGKVFSAGALGYTTNDMMNPAFVAQYPFNQTSNTHDILSLIFHPNKSWEAWTGIYAAGEKMRVNAQRGSFIQDIGAPPINLANEVRFGLCQITNNTAASVTTTFTHLRVDFADRRPAV